MFSNSLNSAHLQMLLLISIILPLCLSYPVYGTKRYGRTSGSQQNNWGLSSMVQVPSFYYQPVPRPHTYHPLSIYDHINPYAPEYDDYYYQDPMTYPLYYPSYTRTSDLYQPILPYYYGGNYPYYDTSDPIDEIQEEMLQQDQEREEREDSLPIGQETWYEPDDGLEQSSSDTLDDVNTAFMKNLMLYNKAMTTNKNYKHPNDAYSQSYDEISSWSPEEDEEVMELKNLNENLKKHPFPASNSKQERIQMFQKSSKPQHKSTNYNPNHSENWINFSNNKRNNPLQDLNFNSRKLKPAKQDPMITTTQAPLAHTSTILNTEAPARNPQGGQKEVVMMRPATPVRQPFSEPVMKILAEQGGPERKRNPSVYDTIKHMLEMEKNLEKEYMQQGKEYYRAPMRKRYVSNDEILVKELAGLKKRS